MKNLFSLLLSACLFLFTASNALAEKPVQHLVLPDVETLAEAKQVFADTTAQIKTKTKLDAAELHDIHMITYSLEKAIAYFADNMTGEKQKAAQKMAQVVELVHLGSENNRQVETKIYLEEYFKLAQSFTASL